jgi:hypothetical protein
MTLYPWAASVGVAAAAGGGGATCAADGHPRASKRSADKTRINRRMTVILLIKR